MNPYAILGAVLAWLLSLAAVGYWQNGAGHTAERVVWQARETNELAAANVKIKKLEDEARATERAHANALASIAEQHQKEIADAEIQKQSDVAAARAGRIVLRIPSPCKGPGGGGTATATASPGVGDGGATAELPRETAANLFALADDADAVARQLAQCQKVVREDRAPR